MLANKGEGTSACLRSCKFLDVLHVLLRSAVRSFTQLLQQVLRLLQRRHLQDVSKRHHYILMRENASHLAQPLVNVIIPSCQAKSEG